MSFESDDEDSDLDSVDTESGSREYFKQISDLVKYANINDSLSMSRYINLIYYPLWEDIAQYEDNSGKIYTIMKEIELDNDLEKTIENIYNCYINYFVKLGLNPDNITYQDNSLINNITNEEIEDIPIVFYIIKENEKYYTGEKNYLSSISDNPYQEIVKNLIKKSEYETRDLLVQIYSWAIPNDKILTRITHFADKILEIGAGTGYCTYLLKNRGVDIIATDKNPKNTWTDVIKEDYKKSIETYQDRIVMLCWPIMEFFDLIKDGSYKQKKIIYIGEYAGCTGGLMPKLENSKLIRSVEVIDIPTYRGIHDKGYLITLK